MESLAEAIGRIKAAGEITPPDVLALRRVVYGGPLVTVEEMEAMIGLDRDLRPASPEWVEFFAEAMTDYAVRQEEPQDYIDNGKAAWLIKVFAGGARRAAEVEALIRILETAADAPADLQSFVLAKVKDTIVAAGQVTPLDVARMRRLVFSGGGESNIGVSREEAELLFDVDDATHDAANDGDWPDFFAKAIADSLTAVSPFRLKSREEVAKDEAWLASRESPLGFLGRMARAPDVVGAVRDIVDPFDDEANEWKDATAQMDAAEAAAAPITEQEGAWLLDRLGAAPSVAGQRLIELVAVQSPEFSDALTRLLDHAAIAPDAKVFGRSAA